MRIAVAGDHAGFHLKREIVRDLRDRGVEAIELGALEFDPKDDYPDFAVEMAAALKQGRADRGVLVCGSGVGVCIAVNKHPGLRAGVCHDTYSARQGVEHDDMNVLCLGERVVGPALACEIVRTYVAAKFAAGGRHARRLNKVLEIEKQYLRAPE